MSEVLVNEWGLACWEARHPRQSEQLFVLI
nr:MAG TPA: hypothetical protein [Caudoviricetes sp.]